MFTYVAALAVMFICQNGLTGVIQAPPRRPRPPRKAASRGPLKTENVIYAHTDDAYFKIA